MQSINFEKSGYGTRDVQIVYHGNNITFSIDTKTGKVRRVNRPVSYGARSAYWRWEGRKISEIEAEYNKRYPKKQVSPMELKYNSAAKKLQRMQKELAKLGKEWEQNPEVQKIRDVTNKGKEAKVGGRTGITTSYKQAQKLGDEYVKDVVKSASMLKTLSDKKNIARIQEIYRRTYQGYINLGYRPADIDIGSVWDEVLTYSMQSESSYIYFDSQQLKEQNQIATSSRTRTSRDVLERIREDAIEEWKKAFRDAGLPLPTTQNVSKTPDPLGRTVHAIVLSKLLKF